MMEDDGSMGGFEAFQLHEDNAESEEL
jgi:hypothetical protein